MINLVFLECARLAFKSLETQIEDGGTLFIDADGDYWIEEYIVDSPTLHSKWFYMGSFWRL